MVIKMKTLNVFVLLCISVCYCYAQTIVVELPYNTEKEKIIFQEVVPVEDRSTEELFLIMRKWAIGAFENSEATIQYEDKESGIISGKGVIIVKTKGMVGDVKSTVGFEFKLEAKDGRIRYTFENFIHEGRPEYPMDHGPLEEFYFNQKGLYKKNFVAILEQTKSTVENQMESLKKAFEKSEQDDDWE